MRKIKTCALTVLAACMLLMGSMTAFASGPSQQSPEDPVDIHSYMNPGYRDKVYTINAINLPLRANPSDSAAIACHLQPGNKIKLSGEMEITNGVAWLQVSDSTYHYVGWIKENDLWAHATCNP